MRRSALFLERVVDLGFEVCCTVHERTDDEDTVLLARQTAVSAVAALALATKPEMQVQEQSNKERNNDQSTPDPVSEKRP